jgi:uncharacterized protein
MATKQTKICNEQFLLKVTKDKLMATIQPVDDVVSYQGVDFDEILKEVQQNGIAFGFVNDLKPDNKRVAVIAGGTPPVFGENAKIKPVIKPSVVRSPKATEPGKDMVDYRELGSIVNVREAQLLLEKIPATKGSVGKDVYGMEIRTKDGKDLTIKCGPGVALSEDGLKVTATVQGKFLMQDGKPSVYEEHTVQGDVDLKVGNVAFCGKDLKIQGEVLPGFKVKCMGNVSVLKGVNNAEIHSEGNVYIKGGLVGEDAVIKANGDISVDFCENIDFLEARGDLIIRNFIIQAKAKIAGDIKALEGKGRIIGGSFVAGGSIYAKEVGSDGEVVTDVTVGLNTSLEKRKRKIEEAMAVVPPKLNEVLKDISALNEMKKEEGKNFSEEKTKTLSDLNKLMPKLMERNNQLTELEGQLNEDLDKAADECVYVTNSLYPGVKITIGKAVRVVSNEENKVVAEFNRKKQKILIRSMSNDEKEECKS